jgi:hypothetical protein
MSKPTWAIPAITLSSSRRRRGTARRSTKTPAASQSIVERSAERISARTASRSSVRLILRDSSRRTLYLTSAERAIVDSL